MGKFVRAFINVICIILAIAVILAIGVSIGFYLSNNTDEAENVVQAEKEEFDLQLPGETEKTVITVCEVEAKIFEIGELTSCEGEYTITKGQDFTRYMLDECKIPGTTNHIEITCTGLVKAGYNLDDISVEVDNDSHTIYISLPVAKINSNQIIWDTLVCKENNNILNPIDFEQYRTIIMDIKAEGLLEAESNGLYDRVEQNAKNLISNFLGCFAEYNIVFM